jgi:hypothetical protein
LERPRAHGIGPNAAPGGRASASDRSRAQFVREISGRVRLSRSRLLLRAALLAIGGVFMLWKALDASRAAGAAGGGEALLLRRIALVEGLVGVLALAAAAMALIALRRRPRRHSLHLRDGGSNLSKGSDQ